MKKKENDAKDAKKEAKTTNADQVRERSGTWGAATGTKPKEPAKKTVVKKEKEVRRSSDERRQKRGKRWIHIRLFCYC